MKRYYQIPELNVSPVLSEDLCTISVGFEAAGYGDEIDFSDLT